MQNALIRLFYMITILLIYTAWKAMQLWPTHQVLALILTLFLFITIIGWLFINHLNQNALNTRWFHFLAWLGSLTMGFLGIFILFSIPIDIISFVIYSLNNINKIILHNQNEILYLPKNIHIAVFIISIMIVIFGLIEVLRGARIKEVLISIPNLPKELQNLRIAQISDLHVGPTIRKNYTKAVVQLTNAAQPDIIFITGDLADGKPKFVEPYLRPLAYLKAPFGIYYVTGNHEYYWDAEGLINQAKDLGFIPLLNENQIIDVNGVKLLIAGVTDHIGGSFLNGHHPNIIKAAQSIVKTQFKILLSHRPDTCFEAEKIGFDLQVSGHTHAGQFFPFNLLLPLAYKFYRGLNRYGRMWVYVNSGTGYWGPANRFGIPSEITLIKLTTTIR